MNKYCLKKWNIEDDDTCVWCNNAIETQIHVFWECEKVKILWLKFLDFCQERNFPLSKNLILIGSEEEEHLVNILIIIGKQYIQTTKTNGEELQIKGLISYIKQFIYLEFLVARKNNLVPRFLERWGNLSDLV